MNGIPRQMRWLVLVLGAPTCTILYAAVAPVAALTSNVGASLTGSVADVVVRNWGALVGLVGVMLIYGACESAVRRFVLLVAVDSKLSFIGLVLSSGRDLCAYQGRVAAVIDAIWVIVCALYFVGARGAP